MKPEFSVLLTDDERDVLDSMELLLSSEGYPVEKCVSGKEACGIMAGGTTGVLVLDLNMPGMGGEEVLTWTLENRPEIPVIVVTGSAEVRKAVSCMKRGAYDFFTKPADPDNLKAAVRRALGKRRLEEENRRLLTGFLHPRTGNAEAFRPIVTNSPAMFNLFRYIGVVAGSPEPVLITGESGTGKELIAKALHACSGTDGEFVPVNLAGLDDAFFSDTLFGHRKGAFTGAGDARRGLVEKAAGGTLFLDEIGDLQPASQVKLLRLLQDGEYYRLGSDVPTKVGVKVVAATNRNLQADVKNGTFRLDLYYRLSSHCIRLPSLRERPEDIPLLAHFFLEEASKSLRRPVAEMPGDVLELLIRYPFPGNIRELRSIMYDAFCNQSSGSLLKSYIENRLALSPESGFPSAAIPDPAPSEKIVFPGALPTLKEADELLTAEALRRSGGNQSRAAVLLGISHQALSKRLKAGSAR